MVLYIVFKRPKNQVRLKLKHLKNKSVDLYNEMVELMGDEPAMGTKETTIRMMTEDNESLTPALFNLDDFDDDEHDKSSYTSVGGTTYAWGMGKGIIFGSYTSAPGGMDRAKSGDKRSSSSQPGNNL
ncbi:uncharacterized protein LOC113302501 isoform X2 [Papaver somniferum]|uniref:uncharacterized protein LOC113302501 isoform X2 n=1 Tax=Papaver somniferum TaxID=3469 RepID=UPI000E702758|nr:uncharacterized protein LOC113302501 isoform X2 [Papaver somniferum]